MIGAGPRLDVFFGFDPTADVLHMLVGGDPERHRFNKGMDCICEPEADCIQVRNDWVAIAIHNAYERNRK